jgi:hypothetical protein
MVKNYYFILGVPNNASASDVTAAYETKKRLAARDAMEAAMLGEATEAYECLIDPSRRREYDRTMETTPARPAGDTPQYASSESRITVELEFKKLRKKHDAKKKIIKKVIVIGVFLIFAGTGIHFGIRYFTGKDMTTELPVVAQTINALNTPEQEAEKQHAPAAAISAVKPSTRMYEMKTGGVVTRDRAPCRAQPSSGANVITTMRKDTVIFVTKEIRDSGGTVWYYVSNSQLEGWVDGADVRIYNKY